VGLGAAGGHHHAVEAVFLDFFLDLILSVLATGEQVLVGVNDVRKAFRIGAHGGHVHHTANVDPAVADEHPDPRFLFGDIPLLGNLFKSSVRTSAENELFLFLTPHIIETDEDADRIIDDLGGKARLLRPDTMNLGTMPDTGTVVPGRRIR